MPEGQNGQAITLDPAAQQGQVVTQPASPPQGQTLTQPDAPPAAEQGVVQGQVVDPNQAHFQSLYNRTLAEKFAIEQELARERQARLQVTQATSQARTNPYDPATHPNEFWDWKIQEGINTAAERTRQVMGEQIGQFVQQNVEQQFLHENASDMQRLGITADHIKAYNQMNGIAPHRLDIGWRLMTMPQQIAQTQTQAINQTFQQLRQPNAQQVANPLRGSQSGVIPQAQGKYEDYARQFVDSNGRAYESWPKEVQAAFDRETYNRERAAKQSART